MLKLAPMMKVAILAIFFDPLFSFILAVSRLLSLILIFKSITRSFAQFHLSKFSSLSGLWVLSIETQ